ncbi:hypothetical protein PsYK624_005390 [Phanerochaete sordida]|uniref:F-box domain-containing protein n=1 Tax=Phanerochaete sordida TaxID=48140 RepID=A0A9P3L7Z2_9APHY|nr:hypothetical protein PsYK624_005390 [Phanerochaete sordida]
MPHLPIEVVDHCLSYLRHNPWEPEDAAPYSDRTRDLNSCSLVCRKWCSLAQSHLFHDFFFSFTKGAANFGGQNVVNQAVSDGEAPFVSEYPPTLETLPVFFRAYPHLASRIRAIFLFSDSLDLCNK